MISTSLYRLDAENTPLSLIKRTYIARAAKQNLYSSYRAYGDKGVIFRKVALQLLISADILPFHNAVTFDHVIQNLVIAAEAKLRLLRAVAEYA